MSIQEKINAIKSNISNAYDAFEEMGATIPSEKNSSNLEATARTIPTGIDTSSENPATESDIVQGKESFVNDEKVVGSMKPLTEAGTLYPSEVYFSGEDNEMAHKIEFNERYYTDRNEEYIWVPAETYGDAKPEDVPQGVTFTSESGLKTEGMMERHGWLNFYSEDMEIDGEGDLCIVKNLDKRYYVEETFGAYASASVLGNAKPEEVPKGVFFSSSEGINIEGTAEPSSGGGNVQIATGTFTANGGSRPFIDIDCGFSPDVVFISIPDAYMNYNIPSQNDIAINMTTMETAEENENAVALATSVYGYENDSGEDITMTAVYVQKLETGFRVYGFYEQELNGDWWYSTKTYGYKAITFDYEESAYGNGWTDGVPYDLPLIHNVYVETNGSQVAYDGWSATDYLPCDGVSDIIVTTSTLDSTWEMQYNAFYDKNKVFICSFWSNNYTESPLSIVQFNREKGDEDFVIPSDAYYVRFSHETDWLTELTYTPVK